MILETRATEPFFKNGFLVGCETTREAVIIDPGDEVDQLLDLVRREQLDVKYLLLTHAHMDHITGLGRAKAVLDAPICLHPADHVLYKAAVQQGLAFGFRIEAPPPVDRFYDGPGPWRFGEFEAIVHHTPGHCPGGVCLQVGRVGVPGLDLFVGDTLFAGSIGRTDLPGADHATLIRSIKEVLFAFDEQSRVYPGHGPATTIGEERRTNPFLQ